MQPTHEQMQIVFSYGSIFIMNSFSLLNASKVFFIRSIFVFLRSMMRRRHILIQIITALFNEDIL